MPAYNTPRIGRVLIARPAAMRPDVLFLRSFGEHELDRLWRYHRRALPVDQSASTLALRRLFIQQLRSNAFQSMASISRLNQKLAG